MGTKDISTLVEDIYAVVEKKGGWDTTISDFFKESVGSSMDRRFRNEDDSKPNSLRMSNIGSPCKRKLWYYINNPEEKSKLQPNTLLKFAYGDILESLILSLAKAAGHKVEGEQDEVVVNGIVGHRDAVIDGVTIDVKSASSMSFETFKKNGLRSNDKFGYIMQLTGYVKAGQNDPLVTDKKGGAFLVVDKQHGHLCLDYYDLTPELYLFDKRVNEVKVFTSLPMTPARDIKPVPDGKSGNMKLNTTCSYCDYRWKCWPGLRGFAYSNGPTYLTKVVRVPAVPEFKE